MIIFKSNMVNCDKVSMRKKMVSHLVVLIVFGYSSFQDVNAQVSIDSLLYKAECDDTAALIALGDAYMYGMGVEKNTSKSVVWYKKATKLGSSEAPRKLADYYATSSWPKNFVKYYKLAAERGDVIAQVKLADLYMADDFHTTKSAAKWYLRAAENGHAEAQSNIGWMYIHGKGVKRDREEGIKWYKRAIKNGSASALYRLGYAYLYGYGVMADYKEANRFYAQGAIMGSEEAVEGYLQTQLAVKSAGEPATTEYLAALQNLAKGGDKKSQAELGERYRLGIGVKQDFNLASKWLHKAAYGKDADVEAQLSYGMLYESNELYYRKYTSMGTIYSALYFFHLAAEEGCSMAKTMIGYIYECVFYTPDYEEAYVWYQRAVNGDSPNPQAEYLIGRLYENGRGVERDIVKAKAWYTKAAEHGDMCGRMALSQLNNPTPSNIRSVGHFYIDWQPIPSPSVSRSVKVSAKVVSERELQSCRLLINGHSRRNVERTESQFIRTINEDVPLVGGMNSISLVVNTIDGCDTSFNQSVEYIPPIVPPRLGKERRKALIIGNSDYSNNFSRIPNAGNDAHAMCEKLKELGFSVTQIDNMKRQEMKAIIASLEDFFADADVALFYYAGHGMVVEEGDVTVNYLIPVDTREEDKPLENIACIPLKTIVEKMDCGEAWRTGKLGILIIDACLDNPFQDFKKRVHNTVKAPNGMLIAYSTTMGQSASDGNNVLGHSPYTFTLLQMIDKHMELVELFDQVGRTVYTNYNQMPTMNLGGRVKDFFFDENK